MLVKHGVQTLVLECLDLLIYIFYAIVNYKICIFNKRKNGSFMNVFCSIQSNIFPFFFCKKLVCN